MLWTTLSNNSLAVGQISFWNLNDAQAFFKHIPVYELYLKYLVQEDYLSDLDENNSYGE